MEGKTLRKGRFQDESGKHNESGQRGVHDQSMTTEKSWVMMKDRTDKEHEVWDEAWIIDNANGKVRHGRGTLVLNFTSS